MALNDPTPVYDGDFWSNEVILDPYPHYDRLRTLGPVVRLSRHDAWALTQYDTVRRALLASDIFSSASGCMMNEPMNMATSGIMLCSDDPEHLRMRRLFAKPLQPKALAVLRPRLEALVERRISDLLNRDSFDGVADLAHFLPLAVVTELVGLDEEGRARMLEWAAGIFDAFGPIESQRTLDGLEIAQQVIDYVLERVERANMVPGGWGEALFAAADAGHITEQNARMMLVDYLTPSLDTTINATSAALELFAANPAEYDKLRADPSLIPHAINEVIRIESPIRAFARTVTRDVQWYGAMLAKGDKALMLYACANRDSTKYPDAGRFDVNRKPSDHLGFGMGTHVCAGMHLAKLEISIILETLLRQVARIAASDPVRRPHNTLRGLASLRCSFQANA
ncbi:cytochrome P450 [Sphingomonas sp. UYAg733]